MLPLSHMNFLEASGSLCGFLYPRPSARLLTICAAQLLWTAGVSSVCFRSDWNAPDILSSSAECFLLLRLLSSWYYKWYPGLLHANVRQALSLSCIHGPPCSEFSLLLIHLFFQMNLSFHWTLSFFFFFFFFFNIGQYPPSSAVWLDWNHGLAALS